METPGSSGRAQEEDQVIRSLLARVRRHLDSRPAAAPPDHARHRPISSPHRAHAHLDPVERLGLSAVPLRQARYCVFDLETTGLHPSQGDEIIQIGAVRVVDGRIDETDQFSCLVDPRRSIPKRSIRVHGITPAMVKGQPPLPFALPRLRDFAGDDVLVAYNASFDLAFLKLKEAETGIAFPNPVLDAMMLAMHVAPHAKSHALSAVAAQCGVEASGRHTALGDAVITARVLVALFERLEAKGLTTLGRAHAISSRMMKRRQQEHQF
jgi:DNA polymerase-3 subunit epsilon